MATNSEKKKPATPKKTVSKSGIEEASVGTLVGAEEENAQLKAQLAEQQKQMAEMQAQIQAMMTAMMANNARLSEAPAKTNKMIRFISLKDTNIVLKGTNVWRISGRYNHIDLPEKEARAVAMNMNNYLRKGSVYIDDADFVRENDLDTYYSTLLSDQDLKELLDNDVTKVIETYKSVNDNQKELIIELIRDNRKAGKKVDNNILVELSELSGKNLLSTEEDDE